MAEASSPSSSLHSPMSTLDAFGASLGKLRETLAPLLRRPFDDLVSKLEDGSSAKPQENTNGLEGRLDAARLQVSMAYVLLDLVWFHLRLSGQDPSEHQVIKDLERVRSYFGKIKHVQSGAANASSSTYTEGPSLPGQQNRMRVDQAAAGRFVKNAVHTKFENAGDDEKPTSAGGGIEGATQSETLAATSAASEHKSKKGRTVKDPFEGYDSPKSRETASETSSSAKKRRQSTGDGTESGGLVSQTSSKMEKKQKKKEKKQKR